MTLLTIIRKNLFKRLLSSALTTLSIASGAGLIMTITAVQTQTDAAFRQTSAGYDLILASKGSPLQATLNTLYHLETSTGAIPYAVYQTALRDPRVEAAYPFYVGDSYRGIRVVGTSERFISLGEPSKNRRFEFSEGRVFSDPYEAVLGHEAARRSRAAVGDTLILSHGLTELPTGVERLEHDAHPVVVTGILKPTGTAHDKVIFTDVRTTAVLHEVVRHHDHQEEPHEPVPTELDAVALKMKNPQLALQVAGTLNFPTPDNPVLRMNMARDPYFPFKNTLMAVIPAQQIAALMSIVGNAERVLNWVAQVVAVVAILSVLIALYNSMDSRRRDLAIFRSIGARRSQLLRILVGEAFVIVLVGSLIGWLGAQAVITALSPYLLETAGVLVSPFQSITEDLAILGVLAASSLIAGLIPGWNAYRSDPVRHLQSV